MLKRYVLAAFVVGALDIGEVMIFAGIRNGTSPVRILQSVATGVLGRDSYQGGWQSALLGLALHFFIASVVVAVYFLASRRIEALRESPVIMGAIYGLLVYLFMNFVVLPLSATGGPRFTLVSVLNQLFCHIFLIGIPTALFAKSAMVGGPAHATP